MQGSQGDPALRITWARDILFLIKHSINGGKTSMDHAVELVFIRNLELRHLIEDAIPIVLQIAS